MLGKRIELRSSPNVQHTGAVEVHTEALSDELQRRCLIEANVLLGGEAQYHHDFSPWASAEVVPRCHAG